MKKLLFMSCILFSLFFVACEDNEEIEPVDYSQTFSFSVQNNRSDDVAVSVQLVYRSYYYNKWYYSLGIGTEHIKQEEKIASNKTAKFVLENSVLETIEPWEWSFVLTVEDDVYLGFLKTDERGDSYSPVALDETKIKTDGLHWIRLIPGSTVKPVLTGSLSSASTTGIEEEKKYGTVTENFTVTIGEDVTITLDSVAF